MKIILSTLSLLVAATAFAQAPASPPAATTAEEWFKQHDANNDKFLVKAEVTGTRTDGNFDKFDTNKDGKLDFAEYKAGRDATEGAAAASSSAPAAEGGMGGGEGGMGAGGMGSGAGGEGGMGAGGMGGGMGGGEAPPAN